MSQHLFREIEKLKKMLLSLVAVVEQSVQLSARAVEERDAQLADKVIEGDEEIDLAEVNIEEECLKILALHQPVAIDLRFIIAILKINNDLERIGDLAVNIAERAVFISRMNKIEIPFDFGKMTEKVQFMLKYCIDSLVNLDLKAANDVCMADNEVDEINRNTYIQIQEKIGENPQYFDLFMHYLLICRNLERIADHATNIAQDVIYMIQGEIVRHKKSEDNH